MCREKGKVPLIPLWVIDRGYQKYIVGEIDLNKYNKIIFFWILKYF